MVYTIDNLSKLLNRRPRTLYHMHTKHNMGTLQEVAEGRRLLFSEEEYQKMKYLFSDKSKERLLTNATVARLIEVIKETPMNVYDLARELRVKKSSLQGLIAAMTSEFEELAETPSGLLYWKGCKTPAQSEGNRVRHVYKSRITGKITVWYTYSDIYDAPDPGYMLLATDKCLYVEDVKGQYAYEHDMVQIGDKTVEACGELSKGFRIVGNIYENTMYSG